MVGKFGATREGRGQVGELGKGGLPLIGTYLPIRFMVKIREAGHLKTLN